MQEMDRLGPDGCELQRESLLVKLRAGYEEHYDWRDKLKAAANLPVGLAAKMIGADPLAVLFSEAISRARAIAADAAALEEA
jgi:hypothetical protein